MDEGGRKQVKFILKDGFIHILENTGLLGSKIEAEIVFKYVEDYENKKFSVSVNEGNFVPIKDGKFTIQKEDLNKPQIDIKIKATNDKGVEYFKTDKIPVTYAILFGKSVEDAYPEYLKALNKRLDRTDETLTQILDIMKAIDSKGSLF